MKKILLITITYLTFFGVNAQLSNPGYMGKRFSVQADFGTTLGFFNYLNDKSDFPARQTFIFKPSIMAEAAISKKVSVGVNMTFLSLKANYYNTYNLTDGYYDNDINYSPVYSQGQNIIKYGYRDISVRFSFYKNGYIAPVGNLFFLNIGYVTMKPKDEIVYNETSYYDSYNLPSNISYDRQNISTEANKEKSIKLGLGFSNKYILVDRLYLSSTVEFNLLLGLIGSGGYNSYTDIPTEGQINHDIYTSLGNNSFLNNLMSFTMGVGYLF